MNIALIAFTRIGLFLGERIIGFLRSDGHAVRIAQGFGEEKQSLRAFAESAMRESDGVVFIGAVGIAVRAIAPFLRGKTVDPAVVVVDEQGHFAISLLSGHVGGANRLAQAIAAYINAQPVITTATDGRNAFAVDSWANMHGFTLHPFTLAKDVSAALLAEKPVGFASDFSICGSLPSGLCEVERSLGVYVGIDEQKAPFAQTLRVIPKVLVVGIGCRKWIAQDNLEQSVHHALRTVNASADAIAAIHTIDIKAEEPGIVLMCRAHGWPLRTYPAETLAQAVGEFTTSQFVENTVGVDNVCERAAVMTGGKLMLAKQAGDGVTVAIAAEPYTICFDEVRE